MKKAVVIGAGIGGIATAIRLRKKGYQVEVFERSSLVGGKLAEIRLGDYRFDAGPSLFTMPGYVTELFDLFGEDAKDHFQFIQKEVCCHYFFEDGTFIVARADHQDFAQEMSDKLSVPADAVLSYLEKSKAKYELTSPLFLEKSLHKLSTFFSWDVVKAILRMPKYQIFRSMHEANKAHFNEPRATQLFDRYATYNGSSPYHAPGILTMIPHLEFGIGTYFPRGGMRQIPESLEALARRQGVQFHLNSGVEKILTEKDSAKGVVVNGLNIQADVVVSNMDIVPTYRNLLPDEKAPEKTLSQERSSSALIFYWGIKHQFPNLDLHNIFFAEEYQAEFQTIFEEKALYDDPTVYVHISSKDEPTDAPAGGENWFVMINVPGNTGQDWDQWIPSAKKAILGKLTRLLGTEIAPLIEAEEILDPRRIESRTSSFQGSLYGASSNNRNAAFLRHPNFSKRLKNLYFCGGSVHPGGGIPLCLQSAKIVSSLVPNS